MKNNKDKSILLRTLGDSPRLRILDFLLDNHLFDFSKKEMIEGSGISRPTFYKYFRKIVSEELVVVNRQFGKAKLYKLNTKNPKVKILLEIDQQICKKPKR